MSAPPAGLTAQLSGSLAAAIEDQVGHAAEDQVVQRVLAHDDTLWGPAGQPEVSNRLGWLDIAQRMLAESASDIDAFVADIQQAGLTDLVLLGMGGSSLAPEVIWRTFGASDGHLKLHLLDSTDAAAVRAVKEAVDPAKTLFLASTKSGGTIETLSALTYFSHILGDGAHYAAITDPGSSLVDLAAQHGFRKTFLNDPNIGGRYSALSHFGMVPAALTGAGYKGMLTAAESARAACSDPNTSPGLWLGCAIGALAKGGRDKLTFVVDEPFASFGLWVEQLVAESTGKQGKGILPVADEPLGEPGNYGEDRVFIHIRNAAAPDDGRAAAVQALADDGQPVITLDAGSDPAQLGHLFYVAEFAVAVAGWVLEINPFDQPNVQEAKDATKAVLASGSTVAGADADDATLAETLVDGPPGYVAIMAYVAPSPEFDEAITQLRVQIRETSRMAVTFGYGPRFLHSTGQLHKGGPPNGHFLQLVSNVAPDEEIPGQAFTFEQLKHAQATGDLQTLAKHDLPAARLSLPGDNPAAAIAALTDRIKELI